MNFIISFFIVTTTTGITLFLDNSVVHTYHQLIATTFLIGIIPLAVEMLNPQESYSFSFFIFLSIMIIGLVGFSNMNAKRVEYEKSIVTYQYQNSSRILQNENTLLNSIDKAIVLAQLEENM